MPIAQAATTETAARATSTPEGMEVCSGLPVSSSRAWAPTPIARKKASTVNPSLVHEISATRHPPTTT